MISRHIKPSRDGAHGAAQGASRAGRAARGLLKSAVCLAVLLTALPAPAQLFGDNEARKAILDLRAKVTEMEKQLAERDAALAARIEKIEPTQRGQLELANQVDALRQELAKLRGQIDALANEAANQQKRSRELYTDLDARLKKLEPTSTTVDGKAATVDRDEQAAYDAALALFRARDYREAAAGLRSFIARYPQSAYVASAQYWLGNCHYALKEYKEAIAAQQAVVERYADSPRVPEALLNIAASYSELKDRPRARATLQKIVSEFPGTEAAKTAKDRLASLK